MTTKAERREGVNTLIILAKWEMGKRGVGRTMWEVESGSELTKEAYGEP